MSDLTKEEIKVLAHAVGVEIEEPLLTEVTYNLNALRELLNNLNPAGLDDIEPLPIMLPDQSEMS